MRLTCLLAGLVLLTGLSGCGTMTVISDPNTFSVRGKTATLRDGQAIALNNAYPGETKVIINDNSRPRWDADMQEVTDTAITMLGRHLTRNGVSVTSQAAKTVTLRVREVTAIIIPIPFATRVRTSLQLEAQFGDGTQTIIPAENSSPAGAPRSVDGAILFAVTGLLNDARFVAYVNR